VHTIVVFASSIIARNLAIVRFNLEGSGGKHGTATAPAKITPKKAKKKYPNTKQNNTFYKIKSVKWI
jgi:hypothetical protein